MPGLGRFVASHHRSSDSHQIHEHTRCLCLRGGDATGRPQVMLRGLVAPAFAAEMLRSLADAGDFGGHPALHGVEPFRSFMFSPWANTRAPGAPFAPCRGPLRTSPYRKRAIGNAAALVPGP